MRRKILREKVVVKEWDQYWQENKKPNELLYGIIASFYRRYLIKNSLNYFALKYFKKGAKLLHAGCGGGEVDSDLKKFFSITALDISPNALLSYRENNGPKSKVLLGNIKAIPVRNYSFDGIYNLGVMEHLHPGEIKSVLKEFSRVLKRKGKLILFWPPEYGISVIFFKILVFISKNILGRKRVKFHPREITRIRSKKQIADLFHGTGFRILMQYFGIRDLFTYCVIVARKE
ncbi:MAG: class I SAM-dependent methyltransferase [Patescibacteria group bacterium]